MAAVPNRVRSSALDAEGLRTPPAPAAPAPAAALLSADRLVVEYRRGRSAMRAVDGVSIRIDAGESVGIVGESGCGKSSLARALVGLETPAGGVVRFEGRDLRELRTAAGWRSFRRAVQIVFQDSLGALNPRRSVGEAIEEVLRVHASERHPGAADRRRRVEALLDRVELATAVRERYPHEISGGQRQRAALARALAVEPRVLIADEPVSALDVAVQAQILRLLDRLRRELGLALLLIAHDLAVVRVLCPRAYVLRAGRVVEEGPTGRMFTAPQQDYTRLLLEAVPDVGRALRERALTPPA